MKILFLLKKTAPYGEYSSITAKSGLLNSATITAQELSRYFDVETEVRICIDANSIDKEVTDYRPDICIIEAIWVLPEKFVELKKRHDIPFIVRVHSEIPFLAIESGETIRRIYGYAELDNVYVAFNSLNTWRNFGPEDSFIYLPNIYSTLGRKEISFWEWWDYAKAQKQFKPQKKLYNIGCFGAVRPLKNQLLQAFAAIRWAERNDVHLHYHINSTRLEQGGEACLKNIKALFDAHPHAHLIEHDWMERERFLELVGMMDLGLQLSFNESFNIVAADFVKMRVPILVSPAIDWLSSEQIVDSERTDEIAERISKALVYRTYLTKTANNALRRYNKKALAQWEPYVEN